MHTLLFVVYEMNSEHKHAQAMSISLMRTPRFYIDYKRTTDTFTTILLQWLFPVPLVYYSRRHCLRFPFGSSVFFFSLLFLRFIFSLLLAAAVAHFMNLSSCWFCFCVFLSLLTFLPRTNDYDYYYYYDFMHLFSNRILRQL